MLREEQAIILATNQAQEDFPDYEIGPLMQSSLENRCWYMRVRLYQRPTQSAVDCWYGVYVSNHAWRATLFDHVPRQMQPYRGAFIQPVERLHSMTP
jgi:hypothetical protein